MPGGEKACPSEASSSKRAKEKRNSSTLLALRDARDSSSSSSDKDSGFSDNGSEWPRVGSERSTRSSENVQTRQNQPIFIVQNLLVAQPDSTKTPLTPEEIPGRGSHLILLQQPIPTPKKTPARKTHPPGRKTPFSQPCKKNQVNENKAASDARNLIKRVCTGSEVRPGDRPDNEAAPGSEVGHDHDWRQRRFLNTLEILRRSGLLDATLRTQELLRRSVAADADIELLRRHTELLCQACGGGSGGSGDTAAALADLRRVMEESGSYPGLTSDPRPDERTKASKYCETLREILDPKVNP